jgi:Holliday junction resolvase RusA-like endonuclease
MIVLRAVIPGEPVGKGRPRVTMRAGFARAYTPEKTRSWEAQAASIIAREHSGGVVAGPFCVRIEAVAQRPKRLMRAADNPGRIWRTAKPDGDNVAKAAADALVLAGAIRDDAEIAHWEIFSHYTAKGEAPSVVIELRRIDV